MAAKLTEKPSGTVPGADPFSERQWAFIELFDGNATAAAEKAGYAHPRQAGSRLLANADILAEIRDRRKNNPAILTREERQQFWSKIINDPEEKTVDRNASSKLLGQSQGDFVQRHLHDFTKSSDRELHAKGTEALAVLAAEGDEDE